MTRLHGFRLLLVLGAFALGLTLLASTATKAHAQSAVDQYLENTPDGKGGSGGSKGGSGGSSGGGSQSGGGSSASGSGSGSSGSGSGSGSSGDSGSGSDSDSKAEKKRKKKEQEKKDQAAAGISGDDDNGTGSSSTPKLANQPVSANDADDGGSAGLWIVLGLLVAGPVAVFLWYWFGGRRGDRGPSEAESA
jgi:cobalamin biosynthesis Mg chelatase CobN